MHKRTRQAWMALPVILLIGMAIGWAGSQSSVSAFGWPLFGLCGAIAFVVNWIVFLPSYWLQTEKYYDLTGSLTYLTLVAFGALFGSADPRAWLLGGLVTTWALRLGSFLFLRISQDGSDGRFDALKPDFARFLMTWTLQGLWVFLTLSCALAAITSEASKPLGLMALLGTIIWIVGFGIESIADRQKRRFRHDPANQGRFITSGLWAWSRHPNYFGEITLWVGIALIALPVLSGWQLVTLISPVFVYVLLTRISGIPLLEARELEKWGEEAQFQSYRARTPALFPRPPRRP